MSGVRRCVAGLSVLLAMMLAGANRAAGQATTTVQDTVYSADGAPAQGTVLVSWGAFTTAGGQAIAAGTTSATIGTNGLLTIALVPNAEATPMGSYYTAVFHLSDGTTSRQYWVVPTLVPGGATSVTLAAIQNQVLPTSVAMQTVSKAYVDNAIAAAQAGFPTGTSPYVEKAGDTMTGPLVLPADPVSPNQAADKNYVDNNVASIASGLGSKVSTLPTATQVVGQPTGTQLEVNHLNGELYASQYVNGAGNNGIANALATADCASGCKLEVEPSYTGTDQLNAASIPATGVVVDARGGSEAVTTVNPLAPGAVTSASESVTQLESMTSPQLEALRPGALAINSVALTLSTEAATGGSNQYPGSVENVPYFKSTYGVLALNGTYNTQGQHIQLNNDVSCFSVGDCLAGGQFITSSGGYRDNADEGTHPYDLQVAEDSRVFEATCASGCTTGSTNLNLTVTANPGTQGDGRFLIDLNPANILSTGYVSGGGKTIFATASFTGTNFPVSVFLATAQAATSQPTNMAPGAVTLPIATSGVAAGFATSTTALPQSSGVACVADPGGSVYEMANYTTVDATHIQLTLNKVHVSGAVIAVGGLCGYGLEQKVDTMNGIRQVFPIVGATDATDLYYVDGGGTTVVGRQGDGATGGYLNLSLGIASIARNANVVTVTTASSLPEDVNGLTLTVSGVADSSYDGSYAVTTTGPNTLTYADTGANSTSTGGTVAIVTGSYAMYPMAEVLSVANPGNRQIDGTILLAPNTVAWAVGDAIEEPHFYQQYITLDTELDTQYVPRPIQYTQAGKQYQGNVGPGLRGWQVTNAAPVSNYIGAGGTHTPPDDGYVVSGPWMNDFEVEAGSQAVIYAHCNINGCNRWDSGYDLFMMDTPTSRDVLAYQPQSSTATWYLSGTQYSFSPSAFSAGTINAGTLNVTTLHTSALDGVTIGGTTPAAGSFTNIVATPAATGSGAFALSATSDDTSSTAIGLSNTSTGGHAYTFFSTGADNGPGWFGVYDNTESIGPLAIEGTSSATGLVAVGSGTILGWSSSVNAFGGSLATGFSSPSAGVVDCGNGTAASTSCTLNAGTVAAAMYMGPATAPSGSCSTNGAWVFSQDGHATFCNAGAWVSKI